MWPSAEERRSLAGVKRQVQIIDFLSPHSQSRFLSFCPGADGLVDNRIRAGQGFNLLTILGNEIRRCAGLLGDPL
jgi:hypothetical protein